MYTVVYQSDCGLYKSTRYADCMFTKLLYYSFSGRINKDECNCGTYHTIVYVYWFYYNVIHTKMLYINYL